MKPEVAHRRIEAFGKRFGEAHLYLAYHAAFPLALTPDLLYRLWANFQRDIRGKVLGVPWVAVADLLLSTLCDEVGHELYEMNGSVRNALLSRLKDDSNFGSQRLNELSDFLLEYVRQKIQSDDPDTRDFAQSQQWTALAYTQPSKAAHELALALSRAYQQDRVELVRMASLVETFAEPLAEYEPLLVYARGISNFARGDLQGAAAQLIEKLGQKPQVKVAGVILPIPDQILSQTPDQKEPSSQHFLGEKHLLIIEDEGGRRAFSLEEAVYSLGRDPKSDIRLLSDFVSRRHATLVRQLRENGSYYYQIKDGNLKGKRSANGLVINGCKIHAHDLQNEDEVVFGPQVSVKYYQLDYHAPEYEPIWDEFDITLISPSMLMLEDNFDGEFLESLAAPPPDKQAPLLDNHSSDKKHLLIIEEDERGRREILLEKSAYSIGRDPKSDIRVFSQFVSRRHATLVRHKREDGSRFYRIIDGDLKGKKSANGLLVNGRKLQTHNLEDEDEVVFGPQVSAKYYQLYWDSSEYDNKASEFDITLISPGMIDEFDGVESIWRLLE